MIDPKQTVRDWLLLDAGIVSDVTDRIYCGVLPQTYVADQDGLAITVKVRGGYSHEEMPVITPSMQIEVWGEQLKYAAVQALYEKIRGVLHGMDMIKIGTTMVMSSIEEVYGQDSTDPETGWAVTTGFFLMQMREVS